MVSGSDRDRPTPAHREHGERDRDRQGGAPAGRAGAAQHHQGEGPALEPLDEASLDAVLRDCPL